MCGLCGVFNAADHWTNGPDTARGTLPAADRHMRALAANDILSLYGLRLETWAGRFTLRNRTGKMAVVNNLGELWVEAERLMGRPCDPLDPAILAKLEQSDK